ncbi:MAG: translocation/assembly module TamB domain-containing protein, partial [Rhodospirillales bacterium]|nr:translocation/assembly module TamB domain-containing protein [Rhodospirillales bacterium]
LPIRAPLSGRITASGAAEPVRIEVASDWQPALGQRLAWRLDGQVDLGAGELTAKRISIATEVLQVTGSGRYALETGSAWAALQATYPDLGTLAALLETEAAGHAQLAASVTVGGFGETLSAELSGELQDLVLGEPVAQALLAGRAHFDAELSLEPAEGLRLRKLAVATGAAAVTGDALLSPDFRRLEANYRAEVKDLSGLGAALGRPLSGSARVEGRAEGALDSLGLSGRLTVAQAALDGRRLGELNLDYLTRDVPRQPAGRLDATLSGPLGEFSAKTRYLFDGTALDLSGLSLEGNRTQVRGRARIPVAGGPVAAEISVQAETLEPWLAMAGLAAAGRGRAQVTLTAVGSRQAAALEGAFDDLAIRLEDGASLRISRLEAELKSEDLLGARRATAALTARDFALDELALRTIKAEAAGGPAGGTVNLSVAGKWYGELQLQTEGQMSVSEDTLSLQVSRLDGRALGETTRLQRPLHITRSAKAWEVADLDLAYGAARLSGAARLGTQRVLADLSAAHFPIEALEPFLGAQSATGLVDASIQIDGPPAALTGRMTLNATKLRLAALEDGPVLELTLKGDWQTGRLAVAGRLSGLAEEDAVLSAALPLRLDAATLTPSVPPREALSGRLTWQGPVEPIWALVPITGQTLAGAATLQVELSGTLERPEVIGRLAIQEGEYENFEMGTLLRDLELLIGLEGQRATLTKLTARDGGSGSLSASGAIDLLPEQGFPTELTAEFKTFHLLRRDDVTASTSGRLQLQGTTRSAKLTGRFETDVVEVRIPDRLPAEIVDLEAVEEGAGPAAAAALPPGVAKDRRFQLPLDLTVEMPRRVFLRGRGLDSEWAGTLAVAGTVEQPEVKGKLEMVRGQIAALGKTFKFERGIVDFVGGDTIDPVLDMKAEHAGKDLSVTVQVSGRASDPSISFGSSPDLPQDEIISRLLFGKTTTQLSAFEAAQLATTAAELSGGGVSGGMLEGLRKLLHVDVLRIETVGEGDAASTGITAGTYVTEEIYVGATQGTAAESGTVEVEVEVSPHIFIDTEVDQTGESNVGIKFKWDY